MKTKTKRREPEASDVQPDPVETASRPEAVNDKPKNRFQLSFDLNEDGSPDFSSMRGSTKAKVLQFLRDPKIASEFGVGSSTAAQPVQVFHPAMISGMYDMMGAIEAAMIPKLVKEPKISFEIAKEIFTYTDREKAMLVEPTARVLNKYAADWMIKYQDEIALATILTSITINKVKAAITLAAISQGKAGTITEIRHENDADNPEPKAN